MNDVGTISYILSSRFESPSTPWPGQWLWMLLLMHVNTVAIFYMLNDVTSRIENKTIFQSQTCDHVCQFSILPFWLMIAVDHCIGRTDVSILTILTGKAQRR